MHIRARTAPNMPQKPYMNGINPNKFLKKLIIKLWYYGIINRPVDDLSRREHPDTEYVYISLAGSIVFVLWTIYYIDLFALDGEKLVD